MRRTTTIDGALWELHLHLIALAKARKDVASARIARRSADAHAAARRLIEWHANTPGKNGN